MTLEDQQKINTFSKLNTSMHELQAKIAAKKVGEGEGKQTPCLPAPPPRPRLFAPRTAASAPPRPTRALLPACLAAVGCRGL